MVKKVFRIVPMLLTLLLFISCLLVNNVRASILTVHNCDSLQGVSLAYNGSHASLSLDSQDKVEGLSSISAYMYSTALFTLTFPSVNLASTPVIDFYMKVSANLSMQIELISYSGGYHYSYYTLVFSGTDWQHFTVDLLEPSSGAVPNLSMANGLMFKSSNANGKTIKTDVIQASSSSPEPTPTPTATPSIETIQSIKTALIVFGSTDFNASSYTNYFQRTYNLIRASGIPFDLYLNAGSSTISQATLQGYQEIIVLSSSWSSTPAYDSATVSNILAVASQNGITVKVFDRAINCGFSGIFDVTASSVATSNTVTYNVTSPVAGYPVNATETLSNQFGFFQIGSYNGTKYLEAVYNGTSTPVLISNTYGGATVWFYNLFSSNAMFRNTLQDEHNGMTGYILKYFLRNFKQYPLYTLSYGQYEGALSLCADDVNPYFLYESSLRNLINASKTNKVLIQLGLTAFGYPYGLTGYVTMTEGFPAMYSGNPNVGNTAFGTLANWTVLNYKDISDLRDKIKIDLDNDLDFSDEKAISPNENFTLSANFNSEGYSTIMQWYNSYPNRTVATRLYFGYVEPLTTQLSGSNVMMLLSDYCDYWDNRATVYYQSSYHWWGTTPTDGAGYGEYTYWNGTTWSIDDCQTEMQRVYDYYGSLFGVDNVEYKAEYGLSVVTYNQIFAQKNLNVIAASSDLYSNNGNGNYFLYPSNSDYPIFHDKYRFDNTVNKSSVFIISSAYGGLFYLLGHTINDWSPLTQAYTSTFSTPFLNTSVGIATDEEEFAWQQAHNGFLQSFGSSSAYDDSTKTLTLNWNAPVSLKNATLVLPKMVGSESYSSFSYSGSGLIEAYATGENVYLTLASGDGNQTLVVQYGSEPEPTPTSTSTPEPTSTPTPSPSATPTPQTVNGSDVFKINSNSTVSALMFNSEIPELSFTVSGPNGTVGFINASISKSIMENGTLTVFLDGNQIEVNQTETETTYQIYFTYNHSTHNVRFDFSGGNNAMQSEPCYLLVLCVATGVVMLTVVAFKNKWRTKA